MSFSHVAKPKEGHYIVDFQDGAQLELIFKDPFGDEHGNIAHYDYAIAAQGQQSIAGWNKNGCGCEPDFRDEVSSYLQRDDYEDDQLIDFMKTTSYIAISVVQVPITINWIVDTHDWFFLTVGYDSVEFRSFCDGFNSSLS